MDPKFKIGDRVRVHNRNRGFLDHQKGYIKRKGSIFTIAKITDRPDYGRVYWCIDDTDGFYEDQCISPYSCSCIPNNVWEPSCFQCIHLKYP
jgi:hypothetical protein